MPTPSNAQGSTTLAVVVFVVDRTLVTLVEHGSRDPPARTSSIDRLAVQQHARLLEMAAAGSP